LFFIGNSQLPPTPPIEIGVCNKKQAQACSFAPLVTCFCGLKINSGNQLVMLRSSEASRASQVNGILRSEDYAQNDTVLTGLFS
jgi:hypothetical protein